MKRVQYALQLRFLPKSKHPDSIFETEEESEETVLPEGEYGADTYDGSNSETIAAHLEDVVQALGTVDSINLASASVAAKTFVL